MIDIVEITVKAGGGGSGAVSFRREKFVPRGGPDGGDGGGGGDVIVVADRSLKTLKEIGRKRVYGAEDGQRGQGSGKDGRRGQSLTIRVPVGTEVWRVGEDGRKEKAGDLVEEGQKVLVARGGLGGWGNARFSTSVNRAPRIAQKGQPGEDVRLRLELKLLADVGIVGLPNVGKSTLLRAISAARPKVGEYPFTTVEPVLGVVDGGRERFVVADIPGLIEGAHEGAGLGLDFLRHIERTRIILHLVDGSRSEPWADVQAVDEELRQYGQGLGEREQIVVVNKMDLPQAGLRWDEIDGEFHSRGMDPYFISAATGEGVDEVVGRLARVLEEVQRLQAKGAVDGEAGTGGLVRVERAGVRVLREEGGYRVEDGRVVAFAEMMPVEQEEGLAELWRRLRRWGVAGALRRAGARPGDRIRLGRVELEWPA